MNRELKIRDALPEDAGQIGVLLAELRHGYPDELVRKNVEALLGSEHDTLVVAESGDTILGMAHLHTARLIHEPERIARVAALVVKSNSRRKGIGRAIMERLEELAIQAGCAGLELTTSLGRDEAHLFYQSLGYKELSKRFVKQL